MKILISAIACDPQGFSESYVGWLSVKTLAQMAEHEFWVMTCEDSRLSIEKALIEGLVPANVHFVFHGGRQHCSENRLIARLQSWRAYQHWMNTLLETAHTLHSKVGFDLAHHVTWRVACPLWRLGIPLIWGPIGGGETFPKGLLGILSAQARMFEKLRNVSNFLSLRSTSVRACARQAAHVFVVNKETEAVVAQLGVPFKQISTLAGTVFDEERIAGLALKRPKNFDSGVLELFAGGNLEGRKGVAISLRALALVAKEGVKFRYTIGGNGPERDFLKKLAGDLGIAASVEFTDGFGGDAYSEKLAKSHIYLLPSLRESAGLTLMEAMLAGCVPIVAKCGGPGEIVTDECGFRIEPGSMQQMAEEIARGIIYLDQNRETISQLGSAAAARISGTYSASNYRSVVEKGYQRITQS